MEPRKSLNVLHLADVLRPSEHFSPREKGWLLLLRQNPLQRRRWQQAQWQVKEREEATYVFKNMWPISQQVNFSLALVKLRRNRESGAEVGKKSGLF